MATPTRRWVLAGVLAASASACSTQRAGRDLLAAGKPAEALGLLRGGSAEGLRLRALALRGAGRLAQARLELRISLALEELSAEAHRNLGYLEAHEGRLGAARRHLARSLELDPRQPGLRAVLETLGRRRNRLGRRCAPRVPELPETVAGGGACPSPAAAGRRVRELEERAPLLGCEGPALALALEREGCRAAALALWRSLRRESPGDERWAYAEGRLLLSEGRRDEALLHLLDAAYLAKRRGRASLRIGRLLLGAGEKALAAQRAVEALVLAEDADERLTATRLLRDAAAATP
ncbi:MAG: hypothetical protein IT371_17445 [Deltaproteobacteria bacterium]|nr:hypothetical protein [Deltaproteobacteria bacterium]